MIKEKASKSHVAKRKLNGWDEFCRMAYRYSDTKDARVILGKVNRFEAKFRLAINFESVEATGYSRVTLDGYAAGLRLFLAYTAAELLGSLTKEKVDKWVIKDAATASVMRKALASIGEPKYQVFNNKGSNKLSHFLNSRTADAMPAAYCIRVLLAHGEFTVHGISAQSKTVTRAIHSLAEKILHDSERRFLVWLKQQSISNKVKKR